MQLLETLIRTGIMEEEDPFIHGGVLILSVWDPGPYKWERELTTSKHSSTSASLTVEAAWPLDCELEQTLTPLRRFCQSMSFQRQE